MRRVLATFLYYFCWQRVMAWTTGIGITLMILGEALPPRFGFFPVLFGSVLAAGFPITFAGVAFREMISNRRFLMVPEFRSCAAVGLLLLSLCGTGVSLIFANKISPDIPISDPGRFVLLAFSVISAYLLISQWLVIYALGIIGFVLLPVLGLRLWISNDSFTAGFVNAPWLLAALAVVGWIWLIVAARRRSVPKPLAAPAWGHSSAPELQSNRSHYNWLPQWGRAASSVGTMMRGMPDGTGNRVTFLLAVMLTFPVAMWLIMYLLGAPLNDTERGPFSAGFFLTLSLIGIGMQASQAIREWPARLRYLWLRTGGDRNAGWHLMERSLQADIVIIASLATVTAFLFGLFSAIDSKYLVLYVAGCVVFTSFASYAGFWTRAADWHELVHAFMVIFVTFVFFVSGVVFVNHPETPEQLYWLLLSLGALTMIVRALAKRRLTRIDWCAVRPARMQRKNA